MIDMAAYTQKEEIPFSEDVDPRKNAIKSVKEVYRIGIPALRSAKSTRSSSFKDSSVA